MNVLLGIDVGSSACKASLVDLAGAVIEHGRCPLVWEPVAGGAEIDPSEFFKVALAASRSALARVPAARVVAVGVCGLAETGVLLDSRGVPVVASIAWHDRRGDQEAASLASDLGADRFARLTGLPPTRLCSLSKYRWLRASRPEAARGKRWLSVAEWVVRCLGGDEVAELSLASRTGFLDLGRAVWSQELLDWAGAPAGLFPQPSLAGTSAGRASGGLLPEAEGALLTVAGHDHLCAAVGVGAIHPGDVLNSCGTAQALVRPVSAPLPAAVVGRAVASGLTVGWNVLPGFQALQGAFESGLVLQRFLDLLGLPGRIEELESAALAATTGAGGLLADGVTSETSSLSGIGANSSPALVLRAALEALERQTATILSAMDAVAGPRQRLVVTGGWARREALLSIKRAVLGELEHSPVMEAGALGAALLAGRSAALLERA